MVKAGATLVTVGGGALVGYVLYFIFRTLYTARDVPIIFKVATPIVLVGLVLLVIAAIRDKLKARGREHFEEVEN